MTDFKVEKIKLTDLIPDDRNLNIGTERGDYALEESLRKYGFGRPLFVDKKGKIIGGNKTHQKVGEIDLAEEAILVKGDGKTVVVFQREDVDLDTPEGRAMAMADNRVGELNLSWDTEELSQLISDEAIADLDRFWQDEELNFLFDEENKNNTKSSQKEPKEKAIYDGYSILIDCDSELEQTEVLNKLIEMGLKCRALM